MKVSVISFQYRLARRPISITRRASSLSFHFPSAKRQLPKPDVMLRSAGCQSTKYSGGARRTLPYVPQTKSSAVG
jgi:hypothetical protein